VTKRQAFRVEEIPQVAGKGFRLRVRYAAHRIQGVSGQRVSSSRKMNPNLMRSSREDLYFDEGRRVARL
jgi:hypothetical protein